MYAMTNDVVCRVALGNKYGSESDFKEMFTEFGLLLGSIPLWEYIPCLRWMRRFDGLDKRVERVVKEMDKFLASVLQEHRVRERREGDGGELDFMDILLDFQRENASLTPIEDDTIKAIVLVWILFFYHMYVFVLILIAILVCFLIEMFWYVLIMAAPVWLNIFIAGYVRCWN